MFGVAWHWLACGGVLGLIGAGLLWGARKKDWQNWIIAAATPLPIRLVNVRDDVWIHGTADCPEPLVSPHFGLVCLHFSYELEERVTETYRDKDGKTRTRKKWVTRKRQSDSTDFAIVDGEERLSIRGEQAKFDDLTREQQRKGKWRHTVRYFPHPSAPSAIGTVSEQKEYLEPYDEVPLIVTTKTRDAYIEKIESAENWMRRIGFFMLLAGPFFLFYGLLSLGEGHVGWQWGRGGLSLALGAGVLSLLWFVYTYNTLVTYRIRTATAFRQVDVDLKNRYDLIPNLVAAVKGYMQHERELLESLARTRAEALSAGQDEKVALEAEAVQELQQLTVVVEKYPDLQANPQFQHLFKQLQALEEKIAFGRGFYNDAATEYNTGLETFPKVLVARLFGFKPHTRFRVEADERAVPSAAGREDSTAVG